MGISREYHIFEEISLSLEIAFASRGAILENRTIAPYAPLPTDAFYQDIHGMLGYLEIPALVQVEIPLNFYPTPSWTHLELF